MNIWKEYKELKLVIENKGSYLDNLEESQTKIQDHLETYYCDKEMDDGSDNEVSEDKKNKDNAFNVIEEIRESGRV